MASVGILKEIGRHPMRTLRGWVLLFFWGFLTHVLLDCFTTYGTQVFAPFSNQRVAWGTVSVVDPLYTVPFLVCLILATRFARDHSRRRIWNGLGLAWSCVYLSLTAVNHHNVHRDGRRGATRTGNNESAFFHSAYYFQQPPLGMLSWMMEMNFFSHSTRSSMKFR